MNDYEAMKAKLLDQQRRGKLQRSRRIASIAAHLFAYSLLATILILSWLMGDTP